MTGRYGGAMRVVLLLLLLCNGGIFAVTGDLRSALDSLAWLTLIGLFLWEVRLGKTSSAIRIGRLVAAAVILLAAATYVGQREWLDVVNTLLWIGVVVVLEIQIRNPQARSRGLSLALAMLFTGVAGVVAVLLVRGWWFDAYDAVLWIAAFAMIELDAVRTEMRQA